MKNEHRKLAFGAINSITVSTSLSRNQQASHVPVRADIREVAAAQYRA